MFSKDSRYAKLETATYTAADGRSIAYVRRRFLPRAREQTMLGKLTVGAGDRLDLFAQRAVGSATKFWLVCDANEVMNPATLIEPGEVLAVAAATG